MIPTRPILPFTNRRNARKQVTSFLDTTHHEAFKRALEFILREAVHLMQQHPRLQEFCMAMGGWSFHDRKGEPVNTKYIYKSPLCRLISEWDDYLHLTGYGVKVYSNGNVLTDWGTLKVSGTFPQATTGHCTLSPPPLTTTD